jgi:hypothetical protein
MAVCSRPPVWQLYSRHGEALDSAGRGGGLDSREAQVLTLA